MTKAAETLNPLVSSLKEPADNNFAFLDGRYQIVKQLGRGSFGETFIAKDRRRPGHPLCVVKQFSPLQIASDEDLDKARRRFKQEAFILEKLGHHDRIPRLLASYFEESSSEESSEENSEPNGRFYLVQELILGPSLHTCLSDSPQMPLEQTILLLQEILEILSFVHEQGVIHRDIKPENIIYREADRHWVLIDFGAVKQLTTLVNSAEAEGTMAIYSAGYTPSEQLEGQPCIASDLYSLGMLCLQCLSGQSPKMLKHALRQQGLSWLNPVVGHTGLTTILEKMTRPQWENRYQSAQAVLEDMAAIADTLPSVSSSSLPNAQPVEYTPTETFQPKSQSEPKIKIPTKILAPKQPSDSPRTQPKDRHSLGSALSATSTGKPSKQSFANRLQAKPDSKIWRWLNTLNIYSIEQALAFAVCLCIVFVPSIFMVVWAVKSVALSHRSATVAPSELPSPESSSDSSLVILSGTERISGLTFGPNSKTVLSADAAGKITVWDLATQEPIQTIKTFGALNALALSMDGTLAVSGNEYADINLSNLKTGQQLDTLRDHQRPILSLALSADGNTLASSAEDNSLIIWDFKKRRPQHRLTNFSVPIISTALSPNGQQLIGGSEDFTLKVWDVGTGKLLRSLVGHSGSVQSVAISPDGTLLVSGSADGAIKVWKLQTGELIDTLAGHFEAVKAIAISPDGNTIASGSEDGTVKLWNLLLASC